MKPYIKYICIFLLLGMSVNAWGTPTTVTFTFNTDAGLSALNISKPSSGNGTSLSTSTSYTLTPVSMSVTYGGTTDTRVWNSSGNTTLRTYNSDSKHATITFSVSSSYYLTQVVFSGGTSWTANSGTYSSGTWTKANNAEPTSVTFTSTSGNTITTIAVTYETATPADPYTVSFSTGTGNPTQTDITEASAGAGITLPSVTPACSSDGWALYGWATSTVASSTTTAPSIVGKAGETYNPTSNTTLYAVYAKGEYTKITSTSEISSGGKYIIIGVTGGKKYVMSDTYYYDEEYEEYYINGIQVDENSTNKYHAADIKDSWNYIITGSTGAYLIQNTFNATNNYVDTYYDEWYSHSEDALDTYTITFSDGACTIVNKYGTYKNLVFYSDQTFGRSSSSYSVYLYKQTTTPYYWSSPTCKTVTLAVTPAGGGSATFDDNSSTTMSFGDEYTGDITATPTSGWDFVEWVSSDEDAAVVTDDDDPKTAVYATDDATVTAHFYQNHTLTYTLTGVTKTSGPTSITKTEKDGFTATFSINAHYKSPVTCSVAKGGTPLTEDTDYTWDGEELLLSYDDIDGDIVVTVTATAKTYSDYRFSCAELTLTPKLVTASAPIFITSTASKQVRSQDSILIVGNGLTPNQALEFPDLPSKFSIKSRANGDLSVKSDGTIDTVAYIFYTPGSGDTSDGLDKLTGIKVKVGGAKPITKSLTQDIIGRHLPADFVIAAKYNGKWYALPANISTTPTHPYPVEISVDDTDNPSIAYTANTNIYNLYGQNSGAGYLEEAGWYVKLGMKNNSNYPLFGSTSTDIKADNGATVTSNLGKQYWWLMTQTNTSITNPQDAKYIIHSGNNTQSLTLEDGGLWGLYTTNGTDVDEVRLIPASSVVPTEAYFVEWAQYGGVVEVDADGVGAKKVQAVLNGTESAIKSLTQTCTSVKNRASIYNYTLNFNDVGHVIDLAASTSNGAMLTLRWLDNSEDLVAVSNITVPKIIASSTTMSSVESADKPWLQMEVHVLPGVTLTANAGDFSSKDVTIKHLEIYPKATVEVTKGSKDAGTLTATTLVLRNGWSRAGEKTYDVARLYVTPSTATLKATNVYADWYIDYDQYYPIAVPWNAATASFTYRYCTVTPSVGPEANIRLRYYDGNSRATNVQEGVGSGANWKAYGEGSNLAVPSALLPSHGYIMTAKRPSGKAFSIIRMPLTLPSGTWADGSWTTSGESGSVSTTHKDEIAVTAHNSGSTPGYAQGWNLIANPYMALHQGALTYNDDSGDEIEYANVPDINFTEYDQLPIATTKLKPSSAFLVQAPKDGTVTFGTANRKASAPSSYRNEAPKASKQKAYILLNGNEAEDQMGIIIGEQYTVAYELNADLEKLLSDGTSLRTYMRYGDRNMAYVAINAELAKELIPVTVRIPANGEYIFSLHEASTAGELEGVYLTDYLTGTTTNLLYDNYMFTAEAGTNAERFAINAIVGERKTPTGVDIPGVDKNGNEPVKFIWHDKVFILHNNVIYDSTGKRVNVINK